MIARALFDHPEQVLEKEINNETIPIFELSVANIDLGEIVGKMENCRCNPSH
jgi:predicted RNA-binding protein YlqC (UPF0109 family)